MLETTQHVDPAVLGHAMRPEMIEGIVLDRLLGSGATSMVYLAHDREKPEQQYAVKILTRFLTEQEDAMKRWEREAKLILQLKHPNIVRGIREGTAQGRPYLVMEYLQGETYQERLRRLGKLLEEEVFQIAESALAALDAANQLQIIHRDIKPANMLRTSAGELKVMDFGLAKITTDSSITVTGAIVGTPLYVSPEQARCAETIGIRSDIYSLGITLFHLAAGRPPFSELNTSLLLTRKITDDVPDIRTVEPNISSGLAYLIHEMTQRFEADRLASPGEALQLIQEIRNGSLTTTGFTIKEADKPLPEDRRSSFSDLPTLDNAVIQTIASDSQLDTKPQFFNDGEVLFYEDDDSKECYILLSGAVEILKSGRQVAVIQEPGAFIGEMGPLRGEPRSATVRATESTVLLTIREDDFHSFFKRHADMALALAQALASRLEKTTVELQKNQTRIHRLSRLLNEMKGVLHK